MGLVKSLSFNFVEEPHFLVLLVAAIGSAVLHTLGIFPLLWSPYRHYNRYTGMHFFMPAEMFCNVGGTIERASELVFGFDVTRRISSDFGIVGRGTTISWPEITREQESAHVERVRRVLRKKKPEYLRHIVELKCWLRRTIKGMDQLRMHMSGFPVSPLFKERECRVLIMKAYQPLRSVDSVEEFKQVIVHVVRAHHWG
ncbi:hypothetical protein BKA93DRAFT_828181 [Sparassis latifolia]